jgi:hypothetical protein
MKKVLIVVGVVVLLALGAFFWLLSDLDQRVLEAIESAGTEALGVDVSVGSVEIDLKGGRGTIRDFEVANPEGYSRAPLFRADQLTLRLAAGRIELVRLEAPQVRVEGTLRENNVQAVLDGMPESAPPASESEIVDEAGEPVELRLDRVEIVDVLATVDHKDAEDAVEVEIGEIVLVGLEGTGEEIAHQAAGQLMEQIATATKEFLRSAVGAAVEGAVEAVKEGIRERLEEAREESTDDDGDGP